MANGTIAFDTIETSGQIKGTAKSLDVDYLVYGSARVTADITLGGVANSASSLNVSSVADGGTGLQILNLEYFNLVVAV